MSRASQPGSVFPGSPCLGLVRIAVRGLALRVRSPEVLAARSTSPDLPVTHDLRSGLYGCRITASKLNSLKGFEGGAASNHLSTILDNIRSTAIVTTQSVPPRILEFEYVARIDWKALRLRIRIRMTGILSGSTRLVDLTISLVQTPTGFFSISIRSESQLEVDATAAIVCWWFIWY